MYRAVVVFTICLVAANAVPTDGDMNCMRMSHPATLRCCKKDNKISIEFEDSIKECLQLPMMSTSCERELCFAVKKGIASEEGKIKQDTTIQLMEKDFKDDPDLKNLFIDNCVNGDLSKYGPADMCDVLKLRRCMDAQYIISCPEWDNEGPCVGTKELASECVNKFT